MTNKAIPAFCFAFLFLAIRTASAEPVEIATNTYYEVHGASMKEVRKSLDQHSAMTHDFGNRDALTNYRVDIKWATPPVITLKVTFIMPKWAEYQQASKDLQKKWTDYINILQLHEDGHKKIAEDYARAVEQRVVLEGPRPGRNISRDLNNIASDCAKKQLEYDRVTKHGQNQGLKFPL